MAFQWTGWAPNSALATEGTSAAADKRTADAAAMSADVVAEDFQEASADVVAEKLQEASAQAQGPPAQTSRDTSRAETEVPLYNTDLKSANPWTKTFFVVLRIAQSATNEQYTEYNNIENLSQKIKDVHKSCSKKHSKLTPSKPLTYNAKK